MTRFTLLGRLVQGDPCVAQRQRKDQKTGQLKFKNNGEPDCPFFVAVAIPKNPAERFVIQGVPDYESQKALVDGAARAAWPQFFGGQRPPNLVFDASLPHDCTNPSFANKIIDGDGFDDKGQPFSANDGWAGCWVVKCSNGFAPSVEEWVTNWPDPRGGVKTDWVDVAKTGRKIKLGDYISVSGTCETNKSSDSPGMYMNFDKVGFEKEGELIVSRSSVDTGAALGRRDGGAPANPPAATAGAASSSAPAPGPDTSAIAPAYSGYRETAAAPPPPPAGPQMTAAAQYTYDQYKASGWSDEALRSAGFMV